MKRYFLDLNRNGWGLDITKNLSFTDRIEDNYEYLHSTHFLNPQLIIFHGPTNFASSKLPKSALSKTQI